MKKISIGLLIFYALSIILSIIGWLLTDYKALFLLLLLVLCLLTSGISYHLFMSSKNSRGEYNYSMRFCKGISVFAMLIISNIGIIVLDMMMILYIVK